jgi:hypothetical protein
MKSGCDLARGFTEIFKRCKVGVQFRKGNEARRAIGGLERKFQNIDGCGGRFGLFQSPIRTTIISRDGKY